MTSKERVKRAVEFGMPDRLPTSMGIFGCGDVKNVGWNQVGTGDNSLKRTLDEWGCVWERSEVANMGQVTGHPLLEWSALQHFRWPDSDNPAFYEGMEARFEGTDGSYVMTGIFMLLFERMHSLRGFQNTLEDLLLEKDRIADLADRIVDFDLGIIDNIARRFPDRIDGFNFSDDWGTELGPFVSESLWREFFMPRYARLFEAIHAAGWHVWMHSCGKVNALIPSLIEAGVDVLNLMQPRTVGIEEIGRRFAGKVCFSTLCDIQKTLPFGSDEDIRTEAKLILERWSTPTGGLFLCDYEDGTAIGVSDRKKRVMYEAFLEEDPWIPNASNEEHDR